MGWAASGESLSAYQAASGLLDCFFIKGANYTCRKTYYCRSGGNADSALEEEEGSLLANFDALKILHLPRVEITQKNFSMKRFCSRTHNTNTQHVDKYLVYVAHNGQVSKAEEKQVLYL